jgi:4-amino-4-deoxy-L-arabinose transferase-like glycosyltransferase
VVALATGIGLLLVQRVDLAPPERPVWAAAVGLGVVSLVGLGLGAVGLLQPWLLWLLSVAGLAVTGRRLGRALWAAWADLTWRPRARFEILLAGYCGTMLALALAWALTPPTAWDGLVYHLTGPKLYLATGRISHPLDLPYLGFPQLVEMLFAWGMGLAGERAAAPIHWFYGLLAALSLVTAGRRWLGGAAGWLAAAVLLSAPSIVLLAGWPYVDLALLLYVTLAFLALARFCEKGSQAHQWLVLSGVFAGMAISTKYTAIAVVPALGLALSINQISKAESLFCNLQSAICTYLLWCGVVLALWLPWLLRNFLLTGNPMYPFFFGGIYWDNWRAWWYDRPGTGLAYTAPWKLLTAPWDATVWGVEGAAGYSATVGPLFLALLPLLALVWRRLPPARRRWLRAALAFCGVLYGFWLWGVARSALLLQTRLLFPAFGLLALVVGAAVEGLRALWRRPTDLGWLARAVVVWVLALTLVATFLSTAEGRPLGVLLGFESREEFLTRRLGWYLAAVEHINQELPPDAIVLFLWEPRSYHCRVQCWPDALLDRFLHATHLYGYDAEAIAAAWRAQGFTHVLLYRTGYEAIVEAGLDPVTPADVQTLAALVEGHLQPVAAWGDAYELYAFRQP